MYDKIDRLFVVFFKKLFVNLAKSLDFIFNKDGFT